MNRLESLRFRITRLFSNPAKRGWFAPKSSRRRRSSWNLAAGIECLEDRQMLTGSYGAEIFSNGDGVVANRVFRNAGDAAVGVGYSGNYVVVFEEDFTSDRDILFQRYAADGTRVGPVTPVSSTFDDERNPEIAVAADGSFVIVYERVEDNIASIRARRYDADGMPIGQEILVSNAVDDQTDPAIDMANNGDFVVVWTDDDQTDTDIIYRRYNADGTPKDVNDDVTVLSGNTTFSYITPDIAVEPDSGNFVIVYDRVINASNEHDIHYVVVNADGSIQQVGTPVQAAADQGGTETNPTVAINSDGEFLIAWVDNNNAGTVTIFSTLYPSVGMTGETFIQGSGDEVQLESNDVDDTWIITRRTLSMDLVYEVLAQNSSGVQLSATFQSGTNFQDVNLGSNGRGDFVVVGTNLDANPDQVSGFSRLVNSNPVGNDANDTFAEALNLGAITTTSTIRDGRLEVNGDVDMFSFTVTANQSVTIETSPRNADTVDTEIRLFDSNGNLLAVNDNGGVENYSRMEFTFPKAGTYFLGLAHADNDTYNPITGNVDTLSGSIATGDVRLTIFDNAPPPAVANNDNYTLGFNVPNNGTITPNNVMVTQSVFANDTNTTGRMAVLVNQASFGTVSLNANGTFTYTPNPTGPNDFWGFDTFTYRIEGGGGQPSDTATVTLLTHNAVLIQKLFNQFLNRGPDPGGFEQFTRTLNSGVDLGTLAGSQFTSPERLTPIIENLYMAYLNRGPDPGGLANFIGEVQRTGGLTILQTGLAGSEEFFIKASQKRPEIANPNEAFIVDLYITVLGRPQDPRIDDPIGFAAQLNGLNNGLTRFQIALGFIDTRENYINLVNGQITIGTITFQGYFQQYLNRQATPQELEANVSALEAGVTRVQIQQNLINTPEYLNNPIPPTLGTALKTS